MANALARDHSFDQTRDHDRYVFVVALVMGDFITVRFMSGSQSANMGRLIQNDIALLQYPSASATAVILLITVLILIGTLLRFVDIRKEL